MAVNQNLGDRRAAARFEIGGRLWGTLETLESLPIRNISRGGVLVEAPSPMPPESMHRMHLVLPGHQSIAEARVRHVTAIHTVAGGSSYLVGFEFVALEDAAMEHIDGLVAGRALSGDPEVMS